MNHRPFPIVQSVAQLSLLHFCFIAVAASADLAWGMDEPSSAVSSEGDVTSAQRRFDLQQPLEGPAFYEKLGRRDLVEAYQSREQLKNGLKVLGGLTTAMGLVLSVASIAAVTSNTDCSSSPSSWCFAPGLSKSVKLTMGLVSLGFVAGGTGMLVAGFVIDPNPVDAIQRQRLTEQYNDKLNTKPGVEAGAAPPRKAPARIAAAPLVSMSGGGVRLQLSF